MGTTSVLYRLGTDVDWLTLIATITVAVFGWFITLLLQRNNAKYQHKIQIRYDIYKQLLEASQETNGRLNKLAAVSAPLVLMDASMIPYNLKLKKEYKGQWIEYTELECVHEGTKNWQQFVSDLFDDYFAFSDQYHEMLVVFEGWTTAIEPLMHTQEILVNELSRLSRKTHKNILRLQMYNVENGSDWREWNKEDVEVVCQKIQDYSTTATTYIADFMTLAHNELLSEYFGYKKPIRKTLDPRYKVLTREGFVTRLDDDHERKLSEIQAKVKKESDDIDAEDANWTSKV